MEDKVFVIRKMVILDMVVISMTWLTVLLFLSSYFSFIDSYGILIKVFGILYLIGLIWLLVSVRKVYARLIVSIPKDSIGKVSRRKVMKKYTGSSFGKIYHRRSCRFSESIMDKYFEENDEAEYFKGKRYKPCGLCKPNLSKEVDNSNIKKDKK